MHVRAYAYIRTMGAAGLRGVSENAVLNANYVMKRLEGHYDVAAPGRACTSACSRRGGRSGRREREMDIAKRLPRPRLLRASTYFPLIVEEALMIEPTETESKETLDQFCEAMITIAREAETNPQAVLDAPGPRRCAGSIRRRPRASRI